MTNHSDIEDVQNKKEVISTFQTIVEYKEFQRRCELSFGTSNGKNVWDLTLPDGNVLAGTGSALRQDDFLEYLVKHYKFPFAEWVEGCFEDHYPGDDSSDPVIIALNPNNEGWLKLIPGKEDRSWTLRFPDRTKLEGARNPFTYLNPEGLKNFKKEYVAKCLAWLRQEFDELYKITPDSNGK